MICGDEVSVLTDTDKENRDQFIQRLNCIFAPSQVRKIMQAYEKAKNSLRGQARREPDEFGNPIRSFEHARGVALILIDEVCCADVDILCAALLHDVIEDSRCTAEDIDAEFGPSIAQMVVQLTKTPENKALYYQLLKRFGRFGSLLVKLVDRTHNLRTLGSNPQLREKQNTETREEFGALAKSAGERALTQDEKRMVSTTWKLLCSQVEFLYDDPEYS